MKKNEIGVIYSAILAITQNGNMLDELGLFTSEDWDHIEKAYDILRPLVFEKEELSD